MGVITVTGLSAKDSRTTSFIVEAYSDSGYTTLVDAGTAPAVWDSANGISKMLGVIRLRNLTTGSTYYLRSASIIQNYGVGDWRTYSSLAGADPSVSNITFGSGPPSGSGNETDIYFDTSSTSYVLYIYHTGAWHNVTGFGTGTGGSGGGIFSSGSNANGNWVQDPSGRLHQWGTFSAPGDLTFPTPFSSPTGIVVSATEIYPGSGSSNYPNITGSPTTTGCHIGVSGGGSTSVTWMADGPGVATSASVLVDPTTTKGDLIVQAGSSTLARLGIGADGQVLTAKSSATLGVDWETPLANPMTTAGDLIVGGSGGTPTRLAKGADGTVLTMVSGAEAWATPSGGGGSGSLVLLESHAGSAVSHLDFTSWYSSSYDEYEIHLIGVALSTSGAILGIRVSTNGGASYDSGPNYQWCFSFCVASGGSGGFTASDKTRICLGSGGDASGNYPVSGKLTLYAPAASAYKAFVGQLNSKNASDPAGPTLLNGAGTYQSSTAINALQLQINSGTFTGTMRIYGVAH